MNEVNPLVERTRTLIAEIKNDLNLSKYETEKLMKLAINLAYGDKEEKQKIAKIEECKQVFLYFSKEIRNICEEVGCSYCPIHSICYDTSFCPNEWTEEIIEEVFK